MNDFDHTDLQAQLYALLSDLLADEGVFAPDVTPDALYLNSQFEGVVTHSFSLLEETTRCVLERDPPMALPGGHYADHGVFLAPWRFDAEYRVHPSFTPVDFMGLVQRAYDAV